MLPRRCRTRSTMLPEVIAIPSVGYADADIDVHYLTHGSGSSYSCKIPPERFRQLLLYFLAMLHSHRHPARQQTLTIYLAVAQDVQYVFLGFGAENARLYCQPIGPVHAHTTAKLGRVCRTDSSKHSFHCRTDDIGCSTPASISQNRLLCRHAHLAVALEGGDT